MWKIKKEEPNVTSTEVNVEASKLPRPLNYPCHICEIMGQKFMPTKYILPTCSGEHKDANLVKVFTSRLIDLEKFQTDRLHA
jgi:hypothetical protein